MGLAAERYEVRSGRGEGEFPVPEGCLLTVDHDGVDSRGGGVIFCSVSKGSKGAIVSKIKN